MRPEEGRILVEELLAATAHIQLLGLEPATTDPRLAEVHLEPRHLGSEAVLPLPHRLEGPVALVLLPLARLLVLDVVERLVRQPLFLSLQLGLLRAGR